MSETETRNPSGVERENKRLRAALIAARAELDKHGYGDFHYNGPGYRDPEVLVALDAIDQALESDKGDVDPYPCVCGGPDRPCPVRGEGVRLCACGAVYAIPQSDEKAAT